MSAALILPFCSQTLLGGGRNLAVTSVKYLTHILSRVDACYSGKPAFPFACRGADRALALTRPLSLREYGFQHVTCIVNVWSVSSGLELRKHAFKLYIALTIADSDQGDCETAVEFKWKLKFIFYK